MMINEKLPKSWEQVYSTAAQAIDWVSDVRHSSKRLDSEADNLILDLRRLRNVSKRLGDVSTKSVAVGFFGLSQAGKSYLISALAADANGNLETRVDGEVLDFIKHVNPPGGGKEATGLVTRFSRTAKGGIAGYPLELKLFQEIEIAKILINSYFKDFDQQKIVRKIDFSQLNNELNTFEKKKGIGYTGGLLEEDVVDLHDYAMENFGNALEGLKGGYWEKTIRLAPYLSIPDRATLFAVLWGALPELTAIYIELATTLAKLHNAEIVYAPITVLVTEKNGIKSQADSIMNVDMLERLNTPKDSTVQVCPHSATNIDNEVVDISLAQLAFLAAELSFPLVNETRVATFEDVDLLDFPGYRGRLNLLSLSDVKDGNPIPQLLLRGKVAYLFEKYTDSQEMNVLVVCTPSDKQSDVNDVGPVLERWIERTQGETAEKRATKKPGLLWAITMFDKRIGASLSLTEDILNNSWGKGGLLQQTILERFGSYDWLENWSNNQRFKNVYLVRKPGFPVPFLDVDANSGNELAINANYQSKLELLKSTFTGNIDVNDYIDNPAQAWDGMLKLNDGGMERLSDYLAEVCSSSLKQQRIMEQLNDKINYIVNLRFDTWYQAEGAEELNKKNQMIDTVVKGLQAKALLLGEFLKTIQLPDETIRALYQSSDIDTELNAPQSDNDASNLATSNDFGFDTDFSLFGNNDNQLSTESKPIAIKSESKFAKAVFAAWMEHLRNIILSKHVVQFFGYDQKNMSFIIDELITAANRLKLEETLNKQILANEDTGSKRDELESRQVSTIHMIISDFIAWLGFIQGQVTDIPDSRVNSGKKIFSSLLSVPLNEQHGSMSHQLPKLDDKTKIYTQQYIFDWFVAFMKLAQENVGHSAGREISQEQNTRLGSILMQFNAAALPN
ncbi:virulence factor SrfC family protein [Orbus wheelerorum]|uniref:putative virulence factor n=1 Tax=Orbus wheelerorum TaxID=3074111 RepID=UPI00370D180D